MTETKNNLSALVDQVQHGESILILDRGRPVARLESVLGAEDDPEGRVARLERLGLLRRGEAPLPREILMARPPRPSQGGSALEALLAERREGRPSTLEFVCLDDRLLSAARREGFPAPRSF